MLTTRHEAYNFGIVLDDASLYDWMAAEISYTLLKELSGNIQRITDRLIVKFKD